MKTMLHLSKKARLISSLAAGSLLALGVQAASAQDAHPTYNGEVAKIINEIFTISNTSKIIMGIMMITL